MAGSYLDDIFNYDLDSSIETEELNSIVQPSYTYRVENGRIIGMVDGIDAVKQAVHKLLMTVRFGWVIYSENYGSELEYLIGKGMEYAKSDIERTITDAILADDRIESISNFNIVSSTGNTLVVKFQVNTLNNIFTVEQEVSLT